MRLQFICSKKLPGSQKSPYTFFLQSNDNSTQMNFRKQTDRIRPPTTKVYERRNKGNGN